jgi:hypothetical protein
MREHRKEKRKKARQMPMWIQIRMMKMKRKMREMTVMMMKEIKVAVKRGARIQGVMPNPLNQAYHIQLRDIQSNVSL